MKWAIRISIISVVAIAVLFAWYAWNVQRTTTIEGLVDVVIEDNVGTEGAMKALHDAGVIKSRLAFVAYLFATGERSNVKAGTYQFTGEVGLPEVVARITQKKAYRAETQVTLLEGWTNEEIAAYLDKSGVMNSAEYLEVANTRNIFDIIPDANYPFLADKPSAAGLQGFLFPDTYRFFEGETAIAIVQTQLDTFAQKFTPDMIAAVEAQGRTVYDVVNLASIVEKEVPTLKDKKIVAGIFWKRLRVGMRIESDATINYITKKGTTTPNASDLQTESAYNTYRNDGLPPTPINNPSADSIIAAVYPEESPYFFFLTTPDGTVLYSETYEEHLEKRALYY